MSNPFRLVIVDRIARVRFDQGVGMNTLSRGAIEVLGDLVMQLNAQHEAGELSGVILLGNERGLGAGANIGELMNASYDDLAALVDKGHKVLFAIEQSPYPWVAAVDGVCLGGIFELALACHGIIGTSRSQFGFPEIRLNIFPGLGGTQRLPRRCGLMNTLEVILQGKTYNGAAAQAAGMIDGEVGDPAALESCAEAAIRTGFSPRMEQDFSMADQIPAMVMPQILKATSGRQNPRAPFVALEVIAQGVTMSLADGIKLERDRFLEVATSSEAKAGMRFFFTNEQTNKLPRQFKYAKPWTIKRVGVAGAGGFMGSAIAFLAKRAGYDVVAYELPEFSNGVRARIRAKYDPLLQRNKVDADTVERETAAIEVVNNLDGLRPCDLIIEAINENPDTKADFYLALGKITKTDVIVASNSSSMGPEFLQHFFAKSTGGYGEMVGLHFFSPAEHPQRALVEVIVSEVAADPEAIAAVHGFVRKIGKVPVMINDGSPGFLVNAALAEYFLAAEALYREGTPIETIDEAMRKAVFPMGPFEVADSAGIDVAAGMFDFIAKAVPTNRPTPLACLLCDRKRFGVKTGGGFYDYAGANQTIKVAPYAELATLVGERGTRMASNEEIVERCVRALYDKTKQLLEAGIVASAELADLAFVYGIGFAMHLGGPIFYGQQRGWE